MVKVSLEKGLSSLPKPVYLFLQSVLRNESYYSTLAHQLALTSLILEKDGFQIPLSSLEELQATKRILEKEDVLQCQQADHCH
jgi:hypothetical protein